MQAAARSVEHFQQTHAKQFVSREAISILRIDASASRVPNFTRLDATPFPSAQSGILSGLRVLNRWSLSKVSSNPYETPHVTGHTSLLRHRAISGYTCGGSQREVLAP